MVGESGPLVFNAPLALDRDRGQTGRPGPEPFEAGQAL